MTTVLQFDIQTAEQQHKLQQVIEFVSNLKLPFRKVEPADKDTSDWSGNWSTYEMAMPVLARDWDKEDCWDELYEQLQTTTTV